MHGEGLGSSEVDLRFLALPIALELRGALLFLDLTCGSQEDLISVLYTKVRPLKPSAFS